MTRGRWNRTGTLLGLLMSVAALGWVTSRYDWRGIRAAMLGANWNYLFPLGVLMLLNFAVRAVRWQTLFVTEFRPRFAGSFVALMAGYLFNNLLPARAGELMRIHLIGRAEKLPRSAALGTVIVERTLDLLVLLALLFVILFRQSLPGWAGHAGRAVGVFAGLGLLGMIILAVFGERLLRIMLPLVRRGSERAANLLGVAAGSFILGVTTVFAPTRLLQFVLLTSSIWLLEVSVVWCLLQAFGLDLAPVSILFVMLVIALGTMVPASPGYVGTFEFFGLNALALLGLKGDVVLGFVVTLHATLLIVSSVIGALCLVWHGWPQRDAFRVERGGKR